MKEAELLPCPFCGGKKIEFDIGLSDVEGNKLHCVLCADCYSSGPAYGTKREAIAAWNTRKWRPK